MYFDLLFLKVLLEPGIETLPGEKSYIHCCIFSSNYLENEGSIHRKDNSRDSLFIHFRLKEYGFI
jgi:hypothetical protein